MKIIQKFDPLQNTRQLMEMLYDSGMLQEAMLMAAKVDDAQLRAWQAEALQPAQ